jgi:cytochrome c5
MNKKSILRTDPFTLFVILIAIGASYLHFRGGEVKEVTAAAAPEKTAASTVKPSTPALPVADQGPGRIVFEEKFFDFGTVTEGDIIKHKFKFKNEGPGTAKIVKTEASCGCTTLSGVLKDYAPGESGEMEVEIDTKGKKGIVVKTVTVTIDNNDIAKAEISLPMKLEPPPHPKMERMRNINAESKCKTCHLESGVGETGVFLYHRVCAQCHGKKGVGGFARALNDAKWQNVKDAYIHKVIQSGQPDKGMPSFVEGVTPPLTEDQVGSLVKYIRTIVKR